MVYNMYLLYFYVPVEYCESVKQAVFSAGAGCQGHYDQSCWQTSGHGQFRPLAGSHAFTGKIGELTQCEEYKVEMLCPKDKSEQIIAALKLAHPFEEPAFGLVKLD
jgi:structural toxin protein (hemagglutinin/hemolysin) RtxA